MLEPLLHVALHRCEGRAILAAVAVRALIATFFGDERPERAGRIIMGFGRVRGAGNCVGALKAGLLLVRGCAGRLSVYFLDLAACRLLSRRFEGLGLGAVRLRRAQRHLLRPGVRLRTFRVMRHAV